MKLTLLQVINYYFDFTDGFRTSDIDDTVESQQVASIAEKVFHDLNNDVFGNTSRESIVQLEALADSEKPNYLRIPDTAFDIKHDAVMYNISDSLDDIKMKEMIYQPPLAFLDRISHVPTKTTTLEVQDFSGYRMRIVTNKTPEYYTSFDDEHLVFDSYKSTVDNTLQKSKSGIITQQQRTFTPSSTYVIDFPEWFHPTYLNAVMSEASAALREEALPTVARMARTGIIKARKKARVGQRETNKNYGRR